MGRLSPSSRSLFPSSLFVRRSHVAHRVLLVPRPTKGPDGASDAAAQLAPKSFVEAWPELNWEVPAPDGTTPLTHLAQIYGLRAVDQGRLRKVMDQHQRALEDRQLRQTLNTTIAQEAPLPSSRARPRL